jgi:hypothetical protein
LKIYQDGSGFVSVVAARLWILIYWMNGYEFEFDGEVIELMCATSGFKVRYHCRIDISEIGTVVNNTNRFATPLSSFPKHTPQVRLSIPTGTASPATHSPIHYAK